MATRTLSRWLMSIGLAIFALVAINVLVATSFVQGRSAAALINCSGSIQACIDAANDGDTIVIHAGTYTESLTLSKPVSLTGENRDTTIIHAVEGQRVLTVTGATISNSAVISGLTFTGGNLAAAGGWQYPEYCGGGIYSDAPLSMMNLRFISNTASIGGAVVGSDVKVNGGQFVNNVSFQQGGAIYALNVAVRDTEFVGNSGTDPGRASGGAIFADQASIVDSRFEHNTATATGGGVCATSAEITNSTFISNTALSGGAVQSNLFVKLTGVYFAGNQAGLGSIYSSGGALDLQQPGGSAIISGSQFIANSAVDRGGAIFVWSGNNNLWIANTLFANNSAGTAGAALYSASTGAITLLHNTITDVDLNPVSAVAINQSALNVTNTIIANHASAISNTNGSVYEDYNLFFNTVTNPVGVTSGGHSLIGDPKFVDPLHGNFHLQFGSAAIDRGIDAGVYTDLDGNPRPKGMGFDIGAYEYQIGHYLWLPLIRK